MLFIPPCLNIDKNLCYTKLSLEIKNYIDLNFTHIGLPSLYCRCR